MSEQREAMKELAIDVSISEMARKSGARHIQSIDYLDEIIAESYQPGESIDIELSAEAIRIEGSGEIPESWFAAAQAGAYLSSLFPPGRFREVTVRSADRQLTILGDRTIATSFVTAQLGWSATIERTDRVHQETLEKESQRLTYLYEGSDLAVTINGHAVTLEPPVERSFIVGSLRGTISYDGRSRGGLFFYSRGRKISRKTGWKADSSAIDWDGLSIRFHRHPLKHTLTKSSVIVSGTAEKAFEEIRRQLPKILEEFLLSTELEALRQSALDSYQTLLRQLRPACDTPALRSLLEANLRYQDKRGHYREHYTHDYKRDHPRLFRVASPARPNPLTSHLIVLVALAGIALALFLVPRYGHTGGSRQPAVVKDPIDIERAIRGGIFGVRGKEAASVMKKFDGSGVYERIDTKNAILGMEYQLAWTDREPSDLLHSAAALELPLPLRSFVDASDQKKLREVKRYIQANFLWGSIEPEVFDRYPDAIAALEGEKRALCGHATTYAAMLLHELGLRHVRSAFGTFSGAPHQWLEVRDEQGNWRVEEVTPSRVAPEQWAYLPRDQRISAFLALLTSPDWRTLLRAEFDVFRHRPEVMLSTIPGQLLLASGILLILWGLWQLCLLLAGVVGRTVRPALRVGEEGLEMESLKLRDILGVPVSVEDCGSLRYTEAGLVVPRSMALISPRRWILQAIATIRPEPTHESEIYRRLALASSAPIPEADAH